MFFSGAEFRSGKLDTILRRAYSNQYIEKEYEEYNQFPVENKVIFIDDISDMGNYKNLPTLISQLSARFSKVYLSTSPRFDFVSPLESLKKGVF